MSAESDALFVEPVLNPELRSGTWHGWWGEGKRWSTRVGAQAPKFITGGTVARHRMS